MKAIYELPLDVSKQESLLSDMHLADTSQPKPILAQNALWFCRLRWIVVAVLTSYSGLNLVPEQLNRVGLQVPGLWPLIIAGLLVVTNIIFRQRARATHTSDNSCRLNLWFQIVSDLILLTAVIHFLGDLREIIAFAYLFHIVLACIFFDRKQSFWVLAIALGLYGALGVLESKGWIARYSLFTTDAPAVVSPLRPLLSNGMFVIFSAVVWYLTSYLSDIVRQRDAALSALNSRLIEAQEAKARHMLRTTHELKAPFAAIQANVQLLTKGYCGSLTPEATEVLSRIDRRCRRLANEINEMLQLANLRSARPDVGPWKTLNLAAVMRWCLAQAQPLATERDITFEATLELCRVRGAEEQLRMLLSNILSNAILYSRPGGRVIVRTGETENNVGRAVIQDFGIGIEADKLPRIFEEYYRTDRAAQFNPSSTGLGLAIVKHIALTHRICVRVESQPDEGTTFILDFPAVKDGQRKQQNE